MTELSDKHKKYIKFFMDIGTKPIPQGGVSMPKSKAKYILSTDEQRDFDNDWNRVWANQKLAILAKWCGHTIKLIKTGFALEMDDDFNTGVLGRLYGLIHLVAPKTTNFTLRVKGDFCIVDSDLDMMAFFSELDKEKRVSSQMTQSMISQQILATYARTLKKDY